MHKLERDLNNSVAEIQFWAVTNKRPITEDKTSVMIVTGKRLNPNWIRLDQLQTELADGSS